MPLLENLAEGFANAAGATNSANAIEKRKGERAKLSDEERHANLDVYNQALDKLTTSIGQIPPDQRNFKNPQWTQLNDALHQTISARTALFHPDTGPGAMDKLAQFLRLKKPDYSRMPQNAGQAKDIMAQTLELGAIPPPGYQPTADEVKSAWRREHGLEPRAVNEKELPTKFASQLTETTDDEGAKHYWRVPLETGAEPEEVNFKGQKVTAKNTPKPIRAWSNKGGKIVSVLLDPATNKPIPGTENSDIQPPSSMTGRITQGFHYWVDDNNQLHKTPQTTISAPMGGGSDVPKTAGEAKKKVAAVAPKKDEILGTTKNSTASAADKDYTVALKLDTIARDVEKKPDDAFNQKRLAVALERIAAGRFTTQALDYIKKVGWGATIEEWANSPTTGALPGSLMRQMIDGAHENLHGAEVARTAAHSSGTSEPIIVTPEEMK